ncbi:MAG: Serine/threonine-protein kinase RsbT [Stenotrophomonas maltophilia]|nr:MAG: Serine/threonine-protein kinase RsbT [Stenotrophomonas maltophilia]
MEVTMDTQQRAQSVTDEAHVDAARRAVVRAASRFSQDETLIGRITVVVQELARNLVRHAGGGEVLYHADARSLEVLAVDKGPGMGNIARCLADSYSTSGTMGSGLGAIQRMSDRFDVFSAPGQGSGVLATFDLGGAPLPAMTGGLLAGAVSTAYPGEDYCGDTWAVRGGRVMVCDGLGHGLLAAQASAKAREVFLNHDATQTLESLMQQLHRALMSTRGGAISLAEIRPEQGQVLFCGMGNVAGTLVAGRARSMVSGNGSVGYRIGRINTFSYPWDDRTLLIMASDGISTRFDLAGYPGLVMRHPSLVAALIHRDFRRHNDDATVVVVRHG